MGIDRPVRKNDGEKTNDAAMMDEQKYFDQKVPRTGCAPPMDRTTRPTKGTL